MGYCHINNVAVAVELMLRRKQAKRVLIVDWDVHHGNGTQKHFWNNPDCLYFSVHRFDGGAFYPFSKDGDLDQIGGPNAMGRTVNVPWPFGGFDDGDYVYVWEMLLIPIAKEFSPDIVVVSCGFDCQEDDKTGGCFVSPTGFAYLTKLLMDPAIAGGKLVLVMEGGVNPDKMADSVSTCVSTLLGDSLKKNSQAKLVSKEVKTVVSHVMSVQRRFWKCIEETAARERLPTRITELEESTS
ncbi:hypothetical protein HDU99_007525 [Rhizoclosmatium hyalinum]|nr:hypothetical protein HDU99_007525 [Rhizoclosmatium hyalinum]